MHELSIVHKIIEEVEAHAVKGGLTSVRLARLKIGRMSGFQKEALEFCLQSYRKGKVTEGMTFAVEEVPVSLLCRSCGHGYTDDRFNDGGFAHEIAHVPALYTPLACTRCGSDSINVVCGQEVQIVSVEGD